MTQAENLVPMIWDLDQSGALYEWILARSTKVEVLEQREARDSVDKVD
jgi:hypothetical protein